MPIQNNCCATVITQQPSQRVSEMTNSLLSKSCVSVQPSMIKLNPYYCSGEFANSCAQEIKQSAFSTAFKAAGGVIGAAVGTLLCATVPGAAVVGGSIGAVAGGALAKQINDHPVCIATPAANKD